MELIIGLGIPLGLLLVMCLLGGSIERAHFRSLEAREAAMLDIVVTTTEKPSADASAEMPPRLVCGTAVISSDYFKTWLFGLRNVFGGESKTYTRLFERARREALLRMKEEARAAGCNAICNIRFESSDIGGNASTNNGKKNKPMNMASCMVTGTAYRR
ncbi:MAG: YbjQ family protein [Kiritimatiellia bacterium]